MEAEENKLYLADIKWKDIRDFKMSNEEVLHFSKVNVHQKSSIEICDPMIDMFVFDPILHKSGQQGKAFTISKLRLLSVFATPTHLIT